MPIPARVPEELVDLHVVRRDPADPAEDGECLEGVPGEEVPDRRPEEGEEEESLARHAAAVAHPHVLLRVQSVEECTIDEVGGPDCGEDELEVGCIV